MSAFDKQGTLRPDRRPTLAVTACVALLMALTSLCACSETPPPGSGRVVDKDGKPVAGVHVLTWRDSSVMPWFPFSRPSRSCDAEHYSVTGDDGAFIIPSNVIKRPSSADASDMQIIAYKRGMAGHTTKFSAKPAFVEPKRLGVDIFPTKENPLVVEFEMRSEAELGERYEEWLLSVDNAAGCSYCSPFRKMVHRDVDDRFDEVRRKNPKVNYADRVDRKCP